MATPLSLLFAAPRLVSDITNSSGPWWCGVHGLSNTHALGQAGNRMISTMDGGRSWSTIIGWENATDDFGGIYSSSGGAFHDPQGDYTFTSPTGRNLNVSAVSSPVTATFSLGTDGSFLRSVDRPFSIVGLPGLNGFRVGTAAASMWLSDGATMLATVVTSGSGGAQSREHGIVVRTRPRAA